jgi:DNA-binding NarL/FixJ family response regulator
MRRTPVSPAPLSHPASGGVVRIAVLDSHALLVDGLRLVFNREPGLTMVGSAGTCAEAFELVALTRPDLLLLEIDLPDGDGLDRLHTLRAACPPTQFLVLTVQWDQCSLLRSVEAGAMGFIGKHQPVTAVLAAIRQVAAGEMVLPADLLMGLLTHRQRCPRGATAHGVVPLAQEPLTALERQVLARAAEGQSSAAIAADLALPVPAVRSHLRRVIGKLNAHSRQDAT